MPQPTQPMDLETTGKLAGLAVSVLALLAFGRRAARWAVRTVVGWAFRPELARSEHTAATLIDVTERLDEVEVTVASVAESLPILTRDVAEMKLDMREIAKDLKSVIQQLGQVQGQNTRRPE